MEQRRMKLLYILNIAEKVNNFSYTSMLAAQALGIEYHIAGNWGYASEEERHADRSRYADRNAHQPARKSPACLSEVYGLVEGLLQSSAVVRGLCRSRKGWGPMNVVEINTYYQYGSTGMRMMWLSAIIRCIIPGPSIFAKSSGIFALPLRWKKYMPMWRKTKPGGSGK